MGCQVSFCFARTTPAAPAAAASSAAAGREMGVRPEGSRHNTLLRGALIRRTQEGCGSLGGENPGAFPVLLLGRRAIP